MSREGKGNAAHTLGKNSKSCFKTDQTITKKLHKAFKNLVRRNVCEICFPFFEDTPTLSRPLSQLVLLDRKTDGEEPPTQAVKTS